MKVLLSIKPKHAEKIFDGSKKYEYRRAIFQKKEVNIVVVYASSPVAKIIGEFKIDRILHEDLPILWIKTKSHSGISEEYFNEYFTNKKKGYAIKIKSIKRYHEPKLLESLMVSSPPQSFMYV